MSNVVNVRIIEPCNVYECILGDEVFVGPFCEIQKSVKMWLKNQNSISLLFVS